MATASFSIDTTDLQKCAKDLAEAGIALNEVVPRAVTEGAHVTALQARALSAWSSRIPGSIHADSTGNTAFVRAGGAGAPHAAAYEHGGHPGVFHHPTYGHAPYVPQAARPFLGPAAIVGEAATERAAQRETDRVLRAQRL